MTTYLITGAAGFIGSHIVERLYGDAANAPGEVDIVGVDNLITGKKENIAPFLDKVEFVEGDIRDFNLCLKLTEGVDFVLHQAALGSVPKSIINPLVVHGHNVTGTLNILHASARNRVQRVILASSSSVYGDTEVLPKWESMIPKPMSPYAASKLACEHYAAAFYRAYGLETVSLRYFNVYGPRQDPDSQYAAVIPRFIKAIQNDRPLIIYGDGKQSRDFTFVEDVVEANIKACHITPSAKFEIGPPVNIGGGKNTTIKELLVTLAQIAGRDVFPKLAEPRAGDVKHSWADLTCARICLGYEPRTDLEDGLRKTFEWYEKKKS